MFSQGTASKNFPLSHQLKKKSTDGIYIYLIILISYVNIAYSSNSRNWDLGNVIWQPFNREIVNEEMTWICFINWGNNVLEK